tara:strand:+ start:551 stop:748 length:198 start_codon:yes stop_codon:yes gene_type:complete
MTIDDLTSQVKSLQQEVKEIKDINKELSATSKILMNKLDKSYEDRIMLRASNLKLKGELKGVANA